MTDIKFESNQNGDQSFGLYVDGKRTGEIAVQVDGDVLTSVHTLVNEDQQGKGYARKLFDQMVAYARKNKMKVIPECHYVASLFKSHPDLYKDVWLKGDED
ncbi:GNAT family N-acetyltransferase [Pedobacter miscanthi]|uniref:N-acetyltransferase n=1 Tax=Pedobacter miscanthi TaxID=2259170 RepID=A0A366L0F5_9SPHI|nr:GNAT family N-acetyltransferase [Pedobacter miscanthi]RBQ06784.1 N-acetyltransferase [Pedobacter miscanthi]